MNLFSINLIVKRKFEIFSGFISRVEYTTFYPWHPQHLNNTYTDRQVWGAGFGGLSCDSYKINIQYIVFFNSSLFKFQQLFWESGGKTAKVGGLSCGL